MVERHVLLGIDVMEHASREDEIETGMTQPLYDMARAGSREDMIGQLNPLKRGGEPIEIANAALFHVPSQELPRVLKELWATLRPIGVLFSSNPRGDNEEGWNGERYGVYYDLERWRELVTGAGFVEITHYYRPPGLPRAQQPLLASLWRK